jgi:outer membrane protein assembly factor BamD
MRYNLAKTSSLLIAALALGLSAPRISARMQSAGGQSGPSSQPAPAPQSGQSGQGTPSAPADPAQPGQGQNSQNQGSQNGTSNTPSQTSQDKTGESKARGKGNSKDKSKDPMNEGKEKTQAGVAPAGVAISSDTNKPDQAGSKKQSKKNAKKQADKKDNSKNAKKNSNKKDATPKNVKKDNTAPRKGKTTTAKKSADKNAPEKDASAEPDKVLYDRAMADVKKSRYTEGRLSLQTLINTYPDSEYLAKAKLAVADSYFKEGGTTNLTQSIQEYIDFQTFFPFLDEAAYAQMQVGMAHYKMMEKSDRDSSQAQGAEDAFQTFLLKYPTNPLVVQAEQRLREVQEVLADGEFKIAHFYYVKQDYRASAARLIEVTDRYPLYSGSDEALWMLGDVYTRAKQVSKNEDDKNHWADLAGKCYTRIARDYPLSHYSADAKARLSSMGMPVPAADPAAVSRMQKEQLYAKAHRENALKKATLQMIKSNPDLSAAPHSGSPNLNPPTDTVSATEVLKSGAAGPTFGISATSSNGDSATSSGDGGPITEAVPGAPASGNPGMSTGVQIISTGGGNAAETQPAAGPPPSQPGMEGSVLNPSVPNVPPNNPPFTSGSGGNAAAAPNTPTTTNAPVSAAPVNPPTPNASGSSATPAPSTAPGSGSGTAATGTASTGTAAAGADGSASSGTAQNGQANGQQSSSSDPKQESSSKKKKGLKKLIPF